MTKNDVVMPLAEMAYNQYMENGIPIPGLPQQFNTPGALYAVKPKGGNNPMNLGSTLPLEQQGEMGRYFSESQITDPMKVFEDRLKFHFGNNGVQNNKLKTAYEEYIQRILDEHSDRVAYGITDENIDKVKRQAAEEFTQAVEKSRLNANDPNIKKLYSPSEIEAAAKHYNEWLQGPMKKYVTNLMGTGLETDPLLKVMNDAPFLPHEIFNTSAPNEFLKKHYKDFSKDRRKQFVEEFGGLYGGNPKELQEMVANSSIGKQTATTPMGKYYEDLIDQTLYPRNIYSNPFYNNEKGFPGMEHLKKSDVITDFLNTSMDDELGFKTIQNSILNDLLEGKIKDLSKLPNRTPANIVQDVVKEKVAEMKALQKSKEAYTDWRQANHNAMPSDVTFTDVDGNPTGTKLVIFDSKIANENPELVTRNLSQDTKDLNHCVGACGMDNGKYMPMVEPHTGVANKGGSSYGPGYLQKIQRDEIQVGSLRAPNGESKATLNLGVERDGTLFVQELQGNKDKNLLVEPKYANDLKNWLNHKNDMGQLSNRPIPLNHIQNLGDISDSQGHINSIQGMMHRNKEWNSNTVSDVFNNIDKSEIPRFFTDKEFEALANKKGIDLTKEK
jgi:hypothetical protein